MTRKFKNFISALPGYKDISTFNNPGIDKTLNGVDFSGTTLFIEQSETIDDDEVSAGPRVGLGNTPEPWKSIPWRFWITGNPHVSKYR